MVKRVLAALPLARTLAQYGRGDLRGDAIAGLTTAVMLIPQGMAYAMLAGLPPIVGLYASMLPLALYALLGSARQLAVGPVAMDSLLVATGVGALAVPGSAEFIAYATLLAGMVGVLHLAMGLLRAGFLVNFLSQPVLSGFASAAALIIGLSQLQHLLGIALPRSQQVHTVLLAAARELGSVEPTTVAIGAGAIALLVGLKRWQPMFPRALAVVVLGSVVVWGLGLEGAVAIVGDVPAGLPPLAIPVIDAAAVADLLPVAVTIALVAFMEAISVAKAVARRHRYQVEPNQELIALGAANLGGALTGAYPVTGGFSRTAVNDSAGARTTVASLITASIVAVTVLFFTPLFYYLPKAVLAAIIMTAVFGLVDIAEARHLWKVKRSDLALMAITFAATLTLGIERGILVGVGASVAWFMIGTTRPHTAVLGRLPGTTVFRNVDRFAEAERTPGVLVVRIDAQFYFGNVDFLQRVLDRLERACGEPLRAVVIDASSVNQLDSSADAALRALLADYRGRGVRLLFAAVKGPVRDVMRRSGMWAALGDENTTYTVADAVDRVSAPRELAPATAP